MASFNGLIDRAKQNFSSSFGGQSQSTETPKSFNGLIERAAANSFVSTVNTFIQDTNNFFNNVEKDTNEENKFNAAEYFSERQKQADSLKLRAADISKYLDENMDSYTPEYYESMMKMLSTYNTEVDDIMSRYQPSLDSKAGMAAYEDEYIAAMEQNEQLRKNQQAATFGVDPMYQNMGIFDGLFQQSTDNSRQAVTDDWTAEQRYNLGFYQNEDPAKARKYAELVNAGQDPFVISKQQEAEKASMMAIDLDSEKREIDRMKADLENYSWNTEFDATSSSERKAFNEEIKRREKEITEREKIYNQAKRLQDSVKFASVTENEDFAVNSGYSSGVDTSIFDQPYGFEDLGQDALTYEYINNPDNVRSKINQNDTSFSAKGYDQLTEEEVGIYNYYYATEGPEKAQQYLDNIQETLNYRMGERIAQSKSGDLWKQYLSAAITGYGGAVSGIQNLFNDDEYIPATAFQQASGMIREDLADVGKMPEFYGDTSLGQIGYDLISTTANMVPSIAAGSLFGPVAGAVTMGASSAGNAYQEALNSGYSKEQARTYAALTGASEAGLEYVLGGISKLGGEIPQQIIKNMVSGVDNAVARAAITLGGSMASEGFEEGLQEVITPWIENLTLYADKDVNWDEVAYSTLLGALSGGLMEGPGVVVNTANVSSVEKQLKSLGAEGNTAELAELIVKQKSGEQLSQDEYIKLVKNEPAMKILKGQTVKTEDTGETVSESAPVEKPKVSKDGRAIQISTNEAVDTLDFASVNKGKATIQLKSGETAEYSDVSFASEAQANQFYAAASLPGIDTENANNLLHTIQDADAGKDVDSVVGIREAYGIGYFGMQESDLESGDAGKLTPELRKAVFDIGRQQRAADAMVKATAKPVTAKPAAGYKKVVFEGKTRKITKKQKAEIDFVDYIAENFSGNTVHVFESYKGRDGKYYYRDNNGKVHRAPNGKYVNGEIWLDLKSGDNQEGLVLNTFAHEMYHHIEKFDKAKAQELAEFVVKELGKKSVDDAVAEQIKKARKAGLGESYFQSRGMTAEQARNEVYMRAMSDFVADSLETMFTRGDPAKAIANLKQENRTLFDEIKAFIDKWVSKLKEFYKDKTISKEGELVAQLEKFEQLQQLFMEGVQGAGENYRAAEIEATDAEQTDRDFEADAQYSIRGDVVDVNGVEYDRVVELDYKVFNKIKRSGKAYIDFIRNNLIKQKITVFDDNGDFEVIEFAGEKERVKKDGSSRDRPVIGELTQARNETKKLVIVNSVETAEISRMAGTSNEHSHQWLDENGWEERTSYVMTKDGTIYPVTLHVAKARDGRNILYDVNVKINEGIAADKIATSQRAKKQAEQAVRTTKPSVNKLTQPDSTVNTEMNSLRNQKPPTVREILSQIDISTRKKNEAHHLGIYQENLSKLAELEPRLAELNDKIAELFKDSKKNAKELLATQSEQRSVKADVNRLNGLVRSFERSPLGKQLVTEARAKAQKEQSRETMKSYKQEQKKLIENMQMEQRVLRAQLNQTDSFATVMGEELARLAKDYESKKIDLETMESEYNRLLRIYESTKARLENNRESQEVQKQRKHVEEKTKSLMKMLAHPTKDAHVPMELQQPLHEFLDSIDFTSPRHARGGAATIKDIAYREALADVRDVIASQITALNNEKDGAFTLDVPADFAQQINDHIKSVKDAAKGLDTNTNRIYEMSSAELKDLNYLLGVINKAVRDIDKLHMQGEKARTSGLAKETVQEMANRKPIKGEDGSKYLWGNSTPWYAFRRYGKAGQKIFKGLMQGQAKLSRNIESIVKFAEATYTNKEVREWERQRHTIQLDSGKTVTMSTAQIMTFLCLSRRDQAIPHMQGGGMRLTSLKKAVDGTNVQNEVVQKEHFTLTLGDVNRINNLLTGRQQEVARKLQQFMQTVGGRFINEISMARWDFMAATETDYFPIQTDDTGRDAKNPDQERTSLFALLNKSFTNAPMKNAKNALVIDSIFNVFANHMSETAEYNAFALPLVDAMKWFNYRERIDIGEGHIKDVSVQKAIEDTLGKNGRRYFTDLMTDINSSQKAGRHEDLFGKILGRSKVSSVAWNTRVAIQQISALPRASMVLKPRYLLAGASKFRLQYAVKEMQKYSGIALWKSMGYYDLNVARSVERQIKHDTSFLDQFNELGMWLPGKMDERTWARIWIATREQIRNDKKLSGEELLQATADLFEDVVYQTQVSDSVLTRSSFMRSKSQVIKEATSFMAEPTLSTNILMYAFEDYEEGHTTLEKAKRGLMIGFTGYALSAVANALLGSLSDAWRDDDEYETFWEKYGQALFGSKEKFFTDGNLFSELNPLEKIIFVKDALSVAKGNEPQSSYSKLYSGIKDLIDAYQSAAEGKTSKTAYGVVYQTLQYLSTVGGVGISNMTRELVDVWNNTFGKWNPDKKLVRYEPDNGEELLNAIQKGTEDDIQRVFGRFETQQKAESALQSAIREKYKNDEITRDEAEELLTVNFDRDSEHDVYWILDEWDYVRENGNTEGYLKYGKFFEAVDSGEDYTAEMDRLIAHGADASDIRSQISRHYHKQYLEDETARDEIREKLRPVYEATGMYADDIEDKFNDWDFEAEYGMTYGEYKAEYREGNVTENELRGAMEFYGLMQYEIAADIRSLNNEIKFVDKYDMTLSEMKDAYDNGDITPNQMRSALAFDGMTQKEAKAWVKQRDIENRLGIDYMEWDDAYKHGDISRQTFYNAMIENGTPQKDADDAILSYDWLKKHVKQYPDLASADGKKFAVRIHADYAPDETLEDYGVSIDAYLEYKKMRPECKGVDANGDGKTDDGTLRDSVFRMIDSLPISNEAKDGLALMSYSRKSIRRNAPWH